MRIEVHFNLTSDGTSHSSFCLYHILLVSANELMIGPDTPGSILVVQSCIL